MPRHEQGQLKVMNHREFMPSLQGVHTRWMRGAGLERLHIRQDRAAQAFTFQGCGSHTF